MIIATTTAPREISTLNVCIKSLRKAGYKDTIFIFSEPGQLSLDQPGLQIEVHDKKKGCFNNYDYVLNWFLKEYKDPEELLLIMQDDLIVREDVFKILKKVKYDGNFGYLNLLTVAQHPGIKEYIKKKEWNKVDKGRWAWGACYLMKRSIIDKIVKCDYYKKHKKGKSDGNHGEMIDGCISQCCKLLNLPMYYHNPSLTQHIGVTSTLEHTGILTGYKFKMKGEFK